MKSSLDILGRRWKIRRVAFFKEDAGKTKRKRRTLGECDYTTRTISILKDVASTIAEDALRHEILHAIAFEAGFTLREKAIDGLVTGLREVGTKNGIEWGKR